MWLDFEDCEKGNTYIRLEDIQSVYVNWDDSWLTIKTPHEVFVFTTKELSSADVAGNPTLRVVDSTEEITDIYADLAKYLRLEEEVTIKIGYHP